MRLTDEVFLEHPFYSAQQLVLHLCRLGHRIGRHRVHRLVVNMGLVPIYQSPWISLSRPPHLVYPYLLRDFLITGPKHVWYADITYNSIRRGFLYLAAIMDWTGRRVLAWRPSNTMEADCCIEALGGALAKFGRSDIFNTDQGSQSTSPRFTALLTTASVRISMDSRGR